MERCPRTRRRDEQARPQWRCSLSPAAFSLRWRGCKAAGRKLAVACSTWAGQAWRVELDPRERGEAAQVEAGQHAHRTKPTLTGQIAKGQCRSHGCLGECFNWQCLHVHKHLSLAKGGVRCKCAEERPPFNPRPACLATSRLSPKPTPPATCTRTKVHCTQDRALSGRRKTTSTSSSDGVGRGGGEEGRTCSRVRGAGHR